MESGESGDVNQGCKIISGESGILDWPAYIMCWVRKVNQLW